MNFIMTLTVTLTLKYLQFFKGLPKCHMRTLLYIDKLLLYVFTWLQQGYTVFGISHNPYRTMTLTFDG